MDYSLHSDLCEGLTTCKTTNIEHSDRKTTILERRGVLKITKPDVQMSSILHAFLLVVQNDKSCLHFLVKAASSVVP